MDMKKVLGPGLESPVLDPGFGLESLLTSLTNCPLNTTVFCNSQLFEQMCQMCFCESLTTFRKHTLFPICISWLPLAIHYPSASDSNFDIGTFLNSFIYLVLLTYKPKHIY